MSAIDTATIAMSGGTLDMQGHNLGTASLHIDNLIISGSALTNLTAVSGSTLPVNVSVLNISGANLISVMTLPTVLAYPTTFHLISYSSKTSGGTWSTPNLPGGYTGSISDGGSTIDVIVSGGPALAKADTWNGGSGTWDTTTLNWISGGPILYADGDLVTFDSTAPGTVSFGTTVSPGSLTVNNSSTTNYLFTGSGKISGATSLIKSGSASLTLNESGGDNFSGGITVNAGTVYLASTGVSLAGGITVNGGTIVLDQSGPIAGNTTIAVGGTVQLGNNDTSGLLPSGSLSDNGTLIFDRSDVSLTNATVIGGSGAVIQSGSGILALNGVNTYGGSTTVNNGTIQVNNNASLGALPSGAVTITNGGTLDLGGNPTANNTNYGAKPFYVAGAGVGNNGAIVNNGTNA